MRRRQRRGPQLRALLAGLLVISGCGESLTENGGELELPDELALIVADDERFSADSADVAEAGFDAVIAARPLTEAEGCWGVARLAEEAAGEPADLVFFERLDLDLSAGVLERSVLVIDRFGLFPVVGEEAWVVSILEEGRLVARLERISSSLDGLLGDEWLGDLTALPPAAVEMRLVGETLRVAWPVGPAVTYRRCGEPGAEQAAGL